MWSSENFDALRKESGVTFEEVSDATGIPSSTLCAYSHGRILPSLSALTAIADYFAVPLDYLAGRMPMDKAKELIENYSATFMELRRAPYEAYLNGRRVLRLNVKQNGESPWPYNLLDAVFKEPWGVMLNPDQYQGLEYALSTLNERTRDCLLSYFKQGKTLVKVGDEQGISRERVRQIVAKGCHMLRHPSRATFIRAGYDAALDTVKNNETTRRLDDMERVLDKRQKELEKRQQSLERWDDVLKERVEARGEITLKELCFTTRATNILRRRGAKNLSDVAEILDSGKFNTFRGVGKTTLAEVTQKVEAILGKDYSRIYDI